MIEVQIGDSRQLIHGLKDKFIDCVVTSPPYWGLRDYGHADQIGLEKTPEEYLKTMLDLFDDVKLKLKDEGNCFVNLGDSYMGSGQDSGKQGRTISQSICPNRLIGEASPTAPVSMKKHHLLKPKCLCMIPERFAWGMIEHGWILRNEIIWAKPNHMPESVTDRLTKSHEVIYHFVKHGKYYYNLDAIREPNKVCGVTDKRPLGIERSRDYEGKWQGNNMSETFGSPRARTQRKHDNTNHAGNGSGVKDHNGYYKADGTLLINPLGKNPGDVWSITTQPYPESHFAVFPLELIRRPILAGCPVGGTVLDPFAGSGTVGEFCRHNDRNAILFELNPDYKKLIEDRAMLLVPELSEWCSTKEDA